MKQFDPLREIIFDYITVSAEITLAIAIIGSIFAGDISIGFSAFFMPFIMGAVSMLPCIPIYIKEDMTIKQVLVQRTAELIVLEAVVLYGISRLLPGILPFAGYAAAAVSTAVIEVLTYVIKWYMEKGEADKVNEKLKEIRKNITEDR